MIDETVGVEGGGGVDSTKPGGNGMTPDIATVVVLEFTTVEPSVPKLPAAVNNTTVSAIVVGILVGTVIVDVVLYKDLPLTHEKYKR